MQSNLREDRHQRVSIEFYKRSAIALMALTIAISAAPAALAAEACQRRSEGVCDGTSIAAFRACRNDVRDDYWIGLGNCRNSSEDRQDCNADVRAERREGYGVCTEQCEARLDVCEDVGQGRFDPIIDPADFIDPADIPASPNPYLPLIPGTVMVYEGDGETITVTVTDETKEILGVECVVVRDLVEEEGVPVEDTMDWFAQDTDGNVWYFGEIALNYEDGEITDIDGSWTGGVDDAKPGILMPAVPTVGDVYRQEWLLDEAEDIAEVLSLSADEAVTPEACAGACLQTLEYSPLEPGHSEHKYYKPGVGLILEVDNQTGDRVELVSVTTR